MPDEVIPAGTEVAAVEPAAVPVVEAPAEPVEGEGGRDRSFNGRIGELTAKAREAERQAEYWRGVAETRNAPAPTTGSAESPRLAIAKQYEDDLRAGKSVAEATARMFDSMDGMNRQAQQGERVAQAKVKAEEWLEKQPELANYDEYLRDGRQVWRTNPDIEKLSKTDPVQAAKLTIMEIREMRSAKSTATANPTIPKGVAGSPGATGAGNGGRKGVTIQELAQQLQEANFLPVDKRQGEIDRIEMEISRLTGGA